MVFKHESEFYTTYSNVEAETQFCEMIIIINYNDYNIEYICILLIYISI